MNQNTLTIPLLARKSRFLTTIVVKHFPDCAPYKIGLNWTRSDSLHAVGVGLLRLRGRARQPIYRVGEKPRTPHRLSFSSNLPGSRVSNRVGAKYEGNHTGSACLFNCKG